MTSKEVSITDNVLGERIKELEALNAELIGFIKEQLVASKWVAEHRTTFDEERAAELIAKAEGK